MHILHIFQTFISLKVMQRFENGKQCFILSWNSMCMIHLKIKRSKSDHRATLNVM